MRDEGGEGSNGVCNRDRLLGERWELGIGNRVCISARLHSPGASLPPPFPRRELLGGLNLLNLPTACSARREEERRRNRKPTGGDGGEAREQHGLRSVHGHKVPGHPVSRSNSCAPTLPFYVGRGRGRGITTSSSIPLPPPPTRLQSHTCAGQITDRCRATRAAGRTCAVAGSGRQ